MKSSIIKYAIGQYLTAEIIEMVSAVEFIVSIDGQLIRVKNTSNKILRINDKVDLQVLGLNPLEFKLISPKRIYPKSSLDRVI